MGNMSAAGGPHPEWDDSYTGPPPPWDIGRPQPAFVRLAEAGALSGALLDAGCGTGEHTILAARQGARALGIDVSPRAIETARRKAAERSISASFQLLDALHLDTLGETFDTIVDSGLFHVFDQPARIQYVTAVHAALRPGGHLQLMCFSDRQPGDWGPTGSPKASCAPRSALAGESMHSSPTASTSTRALEPPPPRPGSRTWSGWHPRAPSSVALQRGLMRGGASCGCRRRRAKPACATVSKLEPHCR